MTQVVLRLLVSEYLLFWICFPLLVKRVLTHLRTYLYSTVLQYAVYLHGLLTQIPIEINPTKQNSQSCSSLRLTWKTFFLTGLQQCNSHRLWGGKLLMANHDNEIEWELHLIWLDCWIWLDCCMWQDLFHSVINKRICNKAVVGPTWYL
jgi:hypothetical protein